MPLGLFLVDPTLADILTALTTLEVKWVIVMGATIFIAGLVYKKFRR